MPQGDFWERLKKRLVEVGNTAADFAEEQAIVGKLKFDILNLRRKADHALHDIGTRVLEMSRKSPNLNPLKDRDVVDLLGLIEDLETEIEKKRREITLVADQVRRPRRGVTPAAPPVEAPKPKKAPAPKKKAAKEVREVEPEAADTSSAPKKRGRPKKEKAAGADVPKKRGRPKKGKAANPDSPPKKRGRPKKTPPVEA